MVEEISIDAALEVRGCVVKPLECLRVIFFFLAKVVERWQSVLFGFRRLNVDISND
jgi:hypothetical protein